MTFTAMCITFGKKARSYTAISRDESSQPFILLTRCPSGNLCEISPADWALGLDLIEICGGGDAVRAREVLQRLSQMPPEAQASTVDRLLLAGLAGLVPEPDDAFSRTVRARLLSAARHVVLDHATTV